MEHGLLILFGDFLLQEKSKKREGLRPFGYIFSDFLGLCSKES